MQIHYAFNPVTYQWLRGDSCVSPDAVLEMIQALKLDGWQVTSCSMPDHLFQQYKNIMDAHNGNMATNYLLEQGTIQAASVVSRVEKSRIPEVPSGVDGGIKDREELLIRFRQELVAKKALLPQLEARLAAAKADETGRVVVSEVQATLDTLVSRIAYLEASIEDDGKDKKRTVIPVAAPIVATSANPAESKVPPKGAGGLAALARERQLSKQATHAVQANPDGSTGSGSESVDSLTSSGTGQFFADLEKK